MNRAHASVYDMHLVLRLQVPEEARVAQAIRDAGSGSGKSFLCRCVLQALDRQGNNEMQEILRIVRHLEQMYQQGLPSEKAAESTEDLSPIRVPVPTAILTELRKFHHG